MSLLLNHGALAQLAWIWLKHFADTVVKAGTPMDNSRDLGLRALDTTPTPCASWFWVSLRMDNVTLPCALQSLTVRYDFNQSLDNVTLPGGLQSLLVWYDFNRVILDIGVRYGMAFSLSLTCDGSIGSGFFVTDRHLHGRAL